jgi:hypothetical protein
MGTTSTNDVGPLVGVPSPPGELRERPAVRSRGSGASAATLDRLRLLAGLGIAGVMTAAPLAIGTVHPVTRAVVFLGCAAVLAIVLVQRHLDGKRLVISPPFMGLALAVVLAIAQLVPLPRAIVALLSPHAHELFETALGPYRVHALSLDPWATAEEVTKLAAYLAFFVAVAAFASQHQRRTRIIKIVAAVATLVAAVGFVQAIAGTDSILFFYKPARQFGAIVRGTFVNPNHFGALLTLGAPCALLLALNRPRWPLLAWIPVAVINVAAVLTMTRASTLSVLLAQGIALGLLRAGQRRVVEGREWRWGLAAGAVVAVSVGVAILGVDYVRNAWSKNLLAELGDPESKFQAWRHALRLVHDYPLTGVGRGAFVEAFTLVSPVAGRTRFLFLENGGLQTVVDFGIPGALLLAGLLGWTAVASWRRLARDRILIAPFAALVGLAVHDLVDFSVELPGVGLVAVALLATLHGTRDSGDETEGRRVVVRRGFLLFPAALAALALGTALFVRRADASGAVLARTARDPRHSAGEVLAQGERLRRRHPADYYIPLVVAARLAHERHPDSIRWINASLRLNPAEAAPHQLAAGLLAQAGRKAQALLEYRCAVASAVDPGAVWTEAARRYPRLDDLIAATPDDSRHLARLADWLVGARRKGDAISVQRRLLERDPRDVRALQALVGLDIDAGDGAAAVQHVRALAALDDSPSTRRLKARTLILSGDLAAAGVILDAGIDLTPETFDLELALADALSRRDKPADARLRLDHAAQVWSADEPLRPRLHEVRAIIERRAGNEHQAQWELDRRKDLLGQ